MATYTSPESKSWTLDDEAGFAEGTWDGTEVENPNYTNKVVLECKLGTNQLGPSVKDWNPGFEEEHPSGTRPMNWRFEDPSTGSTCVQGEPEEAYEGDDFVKIADESEVLWGRGKLILDPEGVSENNLQVDVDPQKTYTIRYHGRYENPEGFLRKGRFDISKKLCII